MICLHIKVALLEWADDLEVFILKGYGTSLNYRMGVPLLKDVIQSMEEAIKAKEGTGKLYKLLVLWSLFLILAFRNSSISLATLLIFF